MLRRFALVTLFASLLLACTKPETPSTVRPQRQQYRVVIASIVEIEPIAQLREGFKLRLQASNLATTHMLKIDEVNAQGDAALTNQIADKIAAERPDLVYVLGTPLAQAIQKRAPGVLLLQGAVTDPVEAGLASSWTGSGRRYIATSDLPPVDKQLQLVKRLTPAVVRLGVLYNPGESNSVAVVKRLRDAAKIESITLVDRPISTTADVPRTLDSLVGRVDALYLPPDNTIHAALPAVSHFVKTHRIPLYATVDDALGKGALATLSLDFRALGRESAELALAVIEGGANPATLPIRVNKNPQISVSADTARTLGVDLGPIQSDATVTIR